MDEQKRLILYYSQGRIDPVAYYTKMAKLKRGIPTVEEKNTIDETHAAFASEAKELSTFLSSWEIKETAFSEEAFTRFVDSVRVDSRSEVTFCLKCGLALTERICS